MRRLLLIFLVVLPIWGISAQSDDIFIIDCPFGLPDSEAEGQTLDCGVFVTNEVPITPTATKLN